MWPFLQALVVRPWDEPSASATSEMRGPKASQLLTIKAFLSSKWQVSANTGKERNVPLRAPRSLPLPFSNKHLREPLLGSVTTSQPGKMCGSDLQAPASPAGWKAGCHSRGPSALPKLCGLQGALSATPSSPLLPITHNIAAAALHCAFALPHLQSFPPHNAFPTSLIKPLLHSHVPASSPQAKTLC